MRFVWRVNELREHCVKPLLVSVCRVRVTRHRNTALPLRADLTPIGQSLFQNIRHFNSLSDSERAMFYQVADLTLYRLLERFPRFWRITKNRAAWLFRALKRNKAHFLIGWNGQIEAFSAAETHRRRSSFAESRFHAAIGALAISYGNAIVVLRLVFRRFSGISDSRARILFGQDRDSDLFKKISDCISHEPELDDEVRSTMTRCVNILKSASKVRNNLLHRYVEYGGLDIIIASNHFISSHADRPAIDSYLVSELFDLADQCDEVCDTLVRFTDPMDQECQAFFELFRQPSPETPFRPAPPHRGGRGSP